MERNNLMPEYRYKIAELDDYIKECKKKGYNVYSNISNLHNLIEFISNWYKIKYPDNIIEMSIESYNANKEKKFYVVKPKHETRKTENLSMYMDYYQLMLRLPESMHQIIECWYKGINEDDTKGNNIYVRVYNKLSKKTQHITIEINKYDGSIDLIYQIVLDNYFKINVSSLEDLNNYSSAPSPKIARSIDFRDINKIFKSHELDLEIRNKVFELIVLKLFETSTDKTVGYIRAKLFINEFNKYIYNLNLDSKIIDEQVKEAQTREDATEDIEIEELTKYVISDITIDNSNNKLIDECGLTFKTLQTLKNDNINNISNLLPSENNVSALDIDIDGRYFNINSRDKIILRNIKKEATSNYQDVISNLEESKCEDKKEEQQRTYKKSIFRRKFIS